MQGITALSESPQVTAYIKAQEERMAVAFMHGYHPGIALVNFCSSMQGLYSAPESLHSHECKLDYIHISVIITALGPVWSAAQRSPSFQQDQAQARRSAEALYQQSFKQLQPKLQDLGACETSNIIWSFAKLGFHPNALVRGMMRTLTERFWQPRRVANGRQRPAAQAASNPTWALATMRHIQTD